MIENKLPRGWVSTSLCEICSEINSGSGFPKIYQGEDSGDYPFAKVGDISRCFRAGEKRINTADSYISNKVREQIKAKIIPIESIVFPKIGEALRGNYRLITSREMLFDNNVMGVTPFPNLIDAEYIYYYLLTQDFGKFSVATTVPSVRRGDIESIKLLLPPLNEQKRIVDKIEELFSELDNGIAALKTAREQLKVYRQAILKHAFEGKLTAKWREENADKLETPEQLLTRLQQERDTHYQQRLEVWEIAVKEWEANGKEGKKPKKPGPLDTSICDKNTPESSLPKGWTWCKIRDLHSDLTDYHANGSYEVLKENVELKDDPDHALMIRATNFEKGNFETDQKYITKEAYDFLSKSKLFGGEILVGKIGNAGKVYFMPSLNRPASLAMNLFCLRFENVNPLFIYYQMISTRTTEQIYRYIKGVGNPTLDKKSLRSLDIALPCKDEQNHLVEKLEELLSRVGNFELEINVNIERIEILRQSILKKAFSGKLVLQDINDEPASELLSQIRAEKEQQTHPVKKSAPKQSRKKVREEN